MCPHYLPASTCRGELPAPTSVGDTWPLVALVHRAPSGFGRQYTRSVYFRNTTLLPLIAPFAKYSPAFLELFQSFLPNDQREKKKKNLVNLNFLFSLSPSLEKIGPRWDCACPLRAYIFPSSHQGQTAAADHFQNFL